MNIAAKLRRVLLSLFQPVAKKISHLYIAFHRPKMTLLDTSTVLNLIRPGDVLLCRSDGEFTNHFIPGFWTHVALYASNSEIVEAVSPCVKVSKLEEFLLSKDYIAVLRPIFATTEQKAIAVAYAKMQASNKIPYDYQFVPDDKEFYCAELIGQSYVVALDGQSPFTKRFSLGIMTYIPNDFYDAIEKFELVWCKQDKKIPARKGLKK